MKSKAFTLLVALSVIGCSQGTTNKVESSNSPQNTVVTDTVIVKTKTTLNQPISENFLVVSSYNSNEKGVYGINLKEFEIIDGKTEVKNRNLDLGEYKEGLMNGKYNATGSSFPVQFDLNNNKAYLSIYSDNEIEDIYYYGKILEYDLQTDSIREIITFSDYFRSWHYSPYNNKIYGFDNASESIISIDTKNLEVNTLHTFRTFPEKLEYVETNQGILSIFAYYSPGNLSKYDVNLTNNDFTLKDSFSSTKYWSYRKGMITQAFKDFETGHAELRILKNSETKSTPFDLSNFNTYWISDSEFLGIQKNKIVKFNTELQRVNEFTKNSIHVIEVLKNSLVIFFLEGKEIKLALVDFDFNQFIEIKGIDQNHLITIVSK
ncbi:hypothetical protein [Roseivirga sp.]|uniref:hypothetical protein n=1 Tax=Roseivirga sp. TaxID=1964215 RepID=UPI002B2683BD|nr:hypothetical protein [Roseivirga sp.]